jgi:acetyl esterase/lipase
MGDASPIGTSAILMTDMLARFPQFNRILNIEYRLSQGPPWPQENPFPAALIDVIAAYSYLVNGLFLQPSNILVMGESEGGTLALQLVRYILAANLPELPLPGGLLLLSPSMDWGNTHETPGASAYENSSTDWVHAFGAGYTSRALLGRLSPSDPRLKAWRSPSINISAQQSSPVQFPQTLFVAGDAEMTFDAIKTASDRVAEDVGGDKVNFLALPDAVHIPLSLPWHMQEKDATYRTIGCWLNIHFRDASETEFTSDTGK